MASSPEVQQISPKWKGKRSCPTFKDDDDDEPSFARSKATHSSTSSTRSSSRPTRSNSRAAAKAAGSQPLIVHIPPAAQSTSTSKKRSLPSFDPPARATTRSRAALQPTQEPNLPRAPLAVALPAASSLKMFKWRNHGANPSVVYTISRDEVEQLVPCLRPGPLSFDMEWPVTFGKRKENKTALIQVSDGKIILLVQISSMYHKIPPSLLSIIQSPSRLIYGVNIRNDARKLARDFPSLPQPRGFVDLSHIAREVAPDRWAAGGRMLSLAKLTEGLVGEELEKPKERTSNWAKPLTPKQCDYAASDVQSGWAILESLRALHETEERAEPWEALLQRLSGTLDEQPPANGVVG